jgi:hypothetical protein
MVDWGTLVAGYAAGVSTIVGVRQLMSDLPRVHVSVTEDAEIIRPGTSVSENVFSLTATNAGHRPVIITSAGFVRARRGWIGIPSDWLLEGALPVTLGEGQYKRLILYKKYRTKENPGPPSGSVWFVTDSVGRTWPRRARWRIRVRRVGNWWRRMTKKEEPWDAAKKDEEARPLP